MNQMLMAIIRALEGMKKLWRERLRNIPSGFYTFAPLVLFVALIACLVPRHEPWADEAQAWELAKSLGFVPLFSRWLHFETSPGLWHVLLRIASTAGMSYAGLHWLTAGIEIVAVAVLLWKAPFPWPIRILLPFGFFLAFQYSLVARSYSLAPLLLFVLAAVWQRRHTQPETVALVLALFANTCAQALAVAIGLTLVLLLEFIERRGWKQFGARRFAWSFILLVAAVGFAVWCCRSPADAPWVIQMHEWSHRSHQTQSGSPMSRWQRWTEVSQLIFQGRFSSFKAAAFNGFAGSNKLGALLWLTLIIFLARQKKLRYLLPAALIIFLGTFTRFSPYHRGLVWILLIFLIWVTWPAREDWSHRCALAAFAVSALVQISWLVKSVPIEWSGPYAPAAAAAPALADYLARGVRVDVAMPAALDGTTPSAYFEVAMQPYFSEQPFANLSSRFWQWNGDPAAYRIFMEDTENKRAVVFAPRYLHREDADLQRLSALGYRSTEKFCGKAIYPPRFLEPEVCYEFYEPPAATSPSATR